jgi:hypothetical protein
MKTVEGFQTITIRGTLKYCTEEAIKEEKKGFAVEKVKAKLIWPFFWHRRYKVTMRKYFLWDGQNLVFVPSTKEIINLIHR